MLNTPPISRAKHAAGLAFLSGELAMKDVVQVDGHLSRVKDFATFNAVYREHFAEPYPALSTVFAAVRCAA